MAGCFICEKTWPQEFSQSDELTKIVGKQLFRPYIICLVSFVMQIYGRLLVGDIRQNRISTIGHYKQGLIYNCFEFMSIGGDLGQKINWIDQFRLLLDFTRARTESIHFDSRGESKFFFLICDSLARIILFLFLIQFDFINFDSV